MRIFRFGGSLRWAAFFMTLLAVVCGWGTFVELDFGTPAASRLIYQSGWFYALVFLLALNILFSVLARIPWKRRHLPFLLAHIGILLLLAGCWVTHRSALEGRMTITEGTRQGRAILPNDWEIQVEFIEKGGSGEAAPEIFQISFHGGPFNRADYSSEGWSRDVLLPSEKRIPERKGFFPRLSRAAFRIHYRLTGWLVGKSSPPSLNHSQTIDLSDRLRLSLDDYLVHADLKTVDPMVIELAWRESDDAEPKNETVVFDFSDLDGTKPDRVVSRRGIRRILPGGGRVIFMTADSRREAESFIRLFPNGNSDEEEGERPTGEADDAAPEPLFELAFDCRGKIVRVPSEKIFALAFPESEMNSTGLEAKPSVELGDGWRIDHLEIVPSLVPGIDSLQGWTARVAVLNETTGETDQLQLSSDWPERDLQGGISGINGALYGYLPDQMKTRPLGKRWDPHIKSPRLEIMESPDHSLFYRYWDGNDYFTSGKIIDQADGVKSASRPPVKIDSKKAGLASFVLRAFSSQDELGVRLVPGAFQKETANEFYGKARLTATMKSSAGEESESFWLRTVPTGLSDGELSFLTRSLVDSEGNRYRLTLKNKSIDPGFSLYVKNFKPVYEPGSSTPSSFASLLDYLPESDDYGAKGGGISENNGVKGTSKARVRPKREDVTVRMNHPGVFYSPTFRSNFWAYQDSFRGPFYPGDKIFDETTAGKLLPGETVPREKIYQTVISLNSDPGRGLKYFGSFFIVFGVALLILRKKGKGPRLSTPRLTSGVPSLGEKGGAMILFFALSLFSSVGFAGQTTEEESKETAKNGVASPMGGAVSGDWDWTDWRLLPVFDGGRIMPLNSFAAMTVKEVCGVTRPTFSVNQALLAELESGKALGLPSLDKMTTGRKLTEEQRERLETAYAEMNRVKANEQMRIAARLREIFPKGRRRFEAHEILFSWIVEPEVWEFIPFIADSGGVVREKILTDDSREKEDGARGEDRRFLSPAELRSSRSYSDRIEKIGRREIKNYPTWDAAVSDGRIDRACATAEGRLSRFDAISFYPCREKVSTVGYYLNQILYPSDGGMASDGTEKGAFLEELDRTVREIRRMTAEGWTDGTDSPFADPDFYLGQTVSVGEKERRFEVIELLRDIHRIAGLYDRNPLAANERILGGLLEKTEKSFERLVRHRNAIFASNKTDFRYRKAILKATRLVAEILDRMEKGNLALYSGGLRSVHKIADKKRIVPVEKDGVVSYNAGPAATLSLQEGGYLAVLPNLAPTYDAGGENAPFVWLPLQAVLWGSDPLRRRSIDWNHPLGTKASETSDEESSISGIEPFGFIETFRKKILRDSDPNEAARAFLNVAEIYLDSDRSDRAEPFRLGMKEFSGLLRQLGEKGNRLREDRLLAKRNAVIKADDAVDAASPAVMEQRAGDASEDEAGSAFDKTAYPAPGSLRAEYDYFRLDPFYWLWFFSLLSLTALVLSALPRPKWTSFFFVLGILFLTAAGGITAVGGGLRAYITGWAPVTNMFETVVLLAFLVLTVTLCYVLQPLIGPPIARSWRWSRISFDRAKRRAKKGDDGSEPDERGFDEFAADSCRTDADRINNDRINAGRMDADRTESRIKRWIIPSRLILTALTLWGTLVVCYREHAFDRGIWQTFLDSFAMQGILDRMAILATMVLVVWFVPRLIVASAILLFIRPKGSDRRAKKKPKTENGPQTPSVLTEMIGRRTFLGVGAFVALGIGLLAYYNTAEFNPNIRPLTAVLRSNFWLTVHVLAIMFSYALGAIAWILSLAMLWNYLFGRYRREDGEIDANAGASKTVSPDPIVCRRFAPIVLKLLQFAVLFLTLGTILGARWADFSWGRFWSWDPKEVWALVTLLIYLTVLHLRKAGYWRVFGLAFGGLLGGLSIVMTWYGLSFVFGGGGRHSYAAGETNKTLILYLLIGANLFFGLAAAIRYAVEKHRADHEKGASQGEKDKR